MKKHLFFFVMAVLFLLPAGLHAQQTLTINHGTWRDRHAPFYSFNLGGYNLTEFVLPADSLTAMNDSLITSMSFQISWPSDTENTNWEVYFRVYVKEVPYTTISAFEGDSTSTVVYYGRLSATNGVMKVTFNEPYHYQGGNLLIGFRNLTTKTGNGNYPDYWWAGTTAPVNTVLWDVKLHDNETFTPFAVNPAILPLTTFEYRNKTFSTVIDFETNDFSQHTFTTINEPWVVVPADNGSGYCMKNSNSNSGGNRARTRAAYNYIVDGYIIFDAKCLGSTSSSFNYDVCTFYIDWGTQFKYGSQVEGWHTYMFPVSAGDHTFDWEYYRFSNSQTRGFFVDNIVFGIGTPCVTPHNFKVRSTSIDTVTLSWLGYSDNYTIRYRTIGGSAWTTLTGITGDNYNLGGIPQGDYEVQISADCEPDNWVADTFSIENLQSTANCYGYVGYNYSGTVGSYSFISFPVQQPSSITAATGTIHSSSYSMYTYIAAYANGYVWCIDRDGDLTIARLDNTHKTISDFETIVSGFESKSINTMSYNPADGLIYYITADSILKCFNPFQPNQITEIGTFNKEILAFAINSLGEAYGVEIESGDLYRINLNDASTMLVGPTGVACELSQGMAFDLQTNELFWAQYYSYSSNGLYKVNTNTGYATYLGKIGQIRAELMGMFVGDDNQPNCEIPLNFTVSNVSYYNATLSWDGNASATEWAIEYDTTASFTTPTAITSSTNQKELTGLTPKTLYYVRVKAICGANGGSPYVTRQFTTPPTCPAPDYVAGSDLQPRSFTVNWNPGHASEWTFEYDTTDNFTAATSVTVSVPYYQATGLTPATTYYIRIKADCGGGDESDWAVRHLTLPVACAAPTNLSVSNISDTSAVLSWNATAASEYVISVNGTELAPITGTTYTLNGLTAGTSYEVKVRGNCGSDGYSDWSSTVTFVSAFCSIDNQCEISYQLNDSYGDGWQGCGINVVDVATNVVIRTLTLPSGSSTRGALPLCNGREIRFEWVNGSFPEETSYTIFTALGDTLFSGSNVLSSPVTYTMSCPACATPTNLAVTRIGSSEVELTWSGDSHASGWVVEYSAAADFTGATTVHVSTNSATLSGLTPHIPYYVHVKTDCGVDGESIWSETANFFTIISTDIWYTYANTTSSGQSWKNRFIRFNMQNPEVVEYATALKNPATYAATYANGYVWFFIGESGDLWRAPLNNHDIGTYETVVPELEDDLVGSMSYNPVDGKIYYLLWSSQTLKCFDPAQPNHVTTIDTIDKFFRTFAINSSGEAFIIDNQGDLYRISLTDASTTLVGNTGVPTNYAQSMAFDHNTGELFWAQFYYTNTSALYVVDPTTAAASLIGHIGGDPNVQATGLFMVPNTTSPTTVVNVGSCSQQASYVPSANQFTYSLTEQIYTAAEIGESGIINSIAFFNNGSTVTRNYDIYIVHTNKSEFFGDDWVPVTTADLVFSGDVQMASNVWSEIPLDIPFDYNGIDNLMILMDDNTGTYLNDLHCSGDIHYENRSLFVCGYNENYNPLTLSNYSSYLNDKTCCLQFKMTPTCQKPHNLNINYNSQHDATLTWDCNATNFNVEYKKTTDATWQSLTTTNHSITLNSLALGDYEVRVKAVCTPGVSESDWETTTFSIADIQSTANWYTLIASSFDHPEWNSKYITFSMQDVTTGTTASAAMSYSTPIATYADGYVWTVDNDPNTHIQSLFRAPLDNNTQTIGALQTVTSGFENGYIDGISYNPTDGRIYYVLNNQTIKSFHPSSPDATTVVCTVSGIYIRSIAFNSQGSAYFIDDIYRRLYHLNLADASYTLVGDLPNAVFLAFDHTTDELFCSCFNTGYHIGLVDTATAAMHDLGYVGGDDYVVAIGLFMASGSANVCSTPANLTASTNLNTATLTWESTAANFNVEYKKATDTQWQQTNTANNSITLSGLDVGDYQVRVQAVCDPGVSESEWDTVAFSIVDIQSDANWYSYVQASIDHPEWDRKFISFSMQDLNAVDTASETIYDYPVAITYANGYVWGCFYDLNSSLIHLSRAPLHNDTKTIGNFAIVKEGFELNYIPSMAFNPIDGRIYYLRSDFKLLSFDPSNPAAVTEIGDYTEDFEKIAINGSGEAFCYDFYTEELYRISLTDATTTLVGTISGTNTIAFDQNTNELFCTAYNGSGEMLYLVNTTTATMQEIGYIGDDSTAAFHTLFMVGNTANICYAPENLTVSSIGMHSATLNWDAGSNNEDNWVVEYATVPDFSGATSVNVTINSLQLFGLNSGANYYVRVKTICDANSESVWTSGSFHTEICPAANQCAISYEFADSYGDGWNGCAINVVDEATDIVLYTLTLEYGLSTVSGTIPVCDGRSIRFEWVDGYYADETSYTVYDANGDTIFSGSDILTTPVTYTVNCPANPNIIEIGSCISGNEYLPSRSESGYTITQQIYTASEINHNGTISGISFYNTGTTQTRDYDMYLVHTSKAKFNDNLDWVAVTPADLVFSGPMELTAGTWTEFALDAPFTYNGTDNLLLVMVDNTGSSMPGVSCNIFSTTEIQALYAYRDGDSYNPTTPYSYIGDYLYEKNCIRMNFGTNCTKPANLAVSENGMNQAKVVWDNSSNANAWIVEYSTAADFTGSTVSYVLTNSCILTGLTPETEYHVRVKADCGADGESYWNVISFTTNPCPFDNQCEITYQLGDTYGDGWGGNAINVVDVTSGNILASWTIDYGSAASGSLFVCNGREIRFEWVSGVDADETSYSVYDVNGLQIFSGQGPILVPVTYMVNCSSSACPVPNNLAVTNFNGNTATVSWTENGNATSWQLCLDGDEANPIDVTENPYTLSGLDPDVFHNVKVRANCGSDYSLWSDPTAFSQVHSTGNWYAYVQSCPNNSSLPNKFVSFTAQDPASATAASDVFPGTLAATYTNGEVWFFNENNTNLYKAPLDNNNKTIGAYETVATNFDGNNNNIASMSYNPVDGRIYYILYTSSFIAKLKSFDPTNLNDVTEIGTFSSYAWSLAIDSNGNAYCTDAMTGNLCQVDLTDATTTPVGNLGFSTTMPYIAFDMSTGELLMGQLTSSSDNGIYLVNPATAEKQLVGYIGGGTGATISGLFMVSETQPICPAPTNLAVNSIFENLVTLSWTENGSATEWQACINGDEANPVFIYDNPYTLDFLAPETSYSVKVRANCGANGYSDWSNEVSFTTQGPPPYFYIDGDDSICPSQTTTLYVNTNMGTNYLWSTGETSQSITVSVGNYSVTVSKNGNAVAHDSFEVKAKQSYNITITKTVCESELPYDWNGVNFDAAGTQEVTLTAANGCDSVVTMTLMLKYAKMAEIAETACDSYEWNGQTYTASGDYDQTFTAANGCDSVVTLHLTINSSYAVSDTKTVCESELPYEWNGVTFDAAGTQEVTLTAANGCDSVVTMTLNVSNRYLMTAEKTVCESELPYEWNGVTFDATGTQEVTLTAANGCDSVVTMTLMLKYAEIAEIAETACNSYEWNGQTYTASGDYDQTFTAANGCDSVVTLHLTVNSSYAVSDTKTVCESELPYEWNGVSFDAAGTQEVTLTAANGCDSVVTMTLMLKYAAAAEIAETACDSYEWNGQIYTVSGDYDQTFTAANGCDSTVTLHLTINSSYAVTDAKTVCESELPYDWNGVTFNAAGTQVVTLTAANGCDSVVTVTLMLKYAEIAEIAETACNSYEWNGQIYTVSGDYDQTFTAANGCDSVVTLHLTINSSYAVTDTKTVCESELPYDWNGVTFDAAGTQEVTLTAANGCDSVVTMTLNVSNRYLMTAEKTVCESELPYDWNGVTFDAAGTQEVTLTAANGCDSVVTMTLMLKYAEIAEIAETACNSYEWNGQIYTVSGEYDQTFTAANGCDSTVTLHLTVNSSYAVTDAQTVCESELPYDWNGVTFNAAGTQEVTLTAANGCDSIVTMTLMLKYAAATEIAEIACDSYVWNGQTYTVSGDYDQTFTAANGCDSVVTLHLIINTSYAVSDTKTVCESELPYDWDGVTFDAAGTQEVTLTAVNGCDSVVTMTLMLKYAEAAEIAETACDSYEWNGQTYTVSGDYDQTFTAANGCDSVVTLHLTVNSSYAVSDTKTVCESELPYEWNGVTFDAAGTQEVTLTAENGCDSVVTMTLMLKYAKMAEIAETVCDSYVWNGQTYTVSGDYDQTFTAVNGCDSTVTLHLTINSSYAVTDAKTVCESELPYTWNGVTFNAAGTQEVTLTAVNGCDSVVTMTLMLKYAETVEIAETACNSYEWNGQTYTASGDYDQTFTAVNGCDSVVTLHLTVNSSYAVTDAQTVCESELPYDWNGVTFDAAGTQTVTLQAVNGCDSVVTMTLMLKYAETAEIAETACNSYEWNGQTYTTTGDYDQTFTAVNGCDSVVTLHLTVNSSYAVTDAKTVCESELPYTWDGVTFNAAGTQEVTLTAENGCDSVVTMTLMLKYAETAEIAETACNSYEWNGQTYTTTGDYDQTFTAVNGCDSVVTLHLTINSSYAVTDTKTVCQSELPYVWNGVTFNAAGTQNVTLEAANGCDSVVTMTLTVNPTYTVTDVRSVCPSELPYTWNGLVFNSAGSQSVTLQATNGCDSTVIMILTVNQTHVATDSRTICENELPYTWNGVTFNAAGMNSATLQDVNGCDSTVIMTLLVNPAYAVTETMSICTSELPYTWNGIVFNAAGSQSLTLQTINGCDSVVTMVLTVNPTYAVTDINSVCPSELPYTWNGVVFSTAGTQTVTLQTVNGCDSVVTMLLTVNQTHVTTDSRTICESELPYEWNGVTFNAAGANTATLQDVNGCDSTVIMTLTVNPTYAISEAMSICESELPYTWNGVEFSAAGTQVLNLQTINGCDSVVTMTLTVNQAVSSEISVSCPDSCYIWNGQSYCASGDYTQTLQTVNGCDSVVTLHLTITVGIDDHNLSAAMTVYPNPTNGIVNVQCTINNVEVETMEYHVFDAYGKLVDVVITDAHGSSTQTEQIDLSGFADGIYFVKAVADGKVVAVRKVVKR